MPHSLMILLKINLVLLLFAAAYYLILRKLTFYVINRIFLLFGILFSTLYPFIDLTELLADSRAVPSFLPELNHRVNQLAQQDSISLVWKMVIGVFYAGVLLMASRLVMQFVSLRRVHQNSNPGQVEEQQVRILADEVSPFSFWQTIYVNPDLHNKQDLTTIIEHEKVHVQEWHTIDIILAEISLVFYWFNPGVWLIKKAVKENIEFITDAKILKRGVDKKAYQYSLLDVSALRPPVAIINNFNLSDLKQRIIMMNAKRSAKVNLTRYLFVLPVLLGLTLAFTVQKKEGKKGIPSKLILSGLSPKSKIATDQIQKHKRSNLPVRKSKNAVDPSKRLALVSVHEDTTPDSLFKVSSTPLNGSKIIMSTPFNVDDDGKGKKVMLSSFVFKDKVDKADSAQSETAAKTPKVIRIFNVSTKVKRSGDSLSRNTLAINGSMASVEDLKKISPDQIRSIVVGKDGVMNIQTGQQ